MDFILKNKFFIFVLVYKDEIEIQFKNERYLNN